MIKYYDKRDIILHILTEIFIYLWYCYLPTKLFRRWNYWTARYRKVKAI